MLPLLLGAYAPPTYLRIRRISNAVTMTVNGVNTQKLASMKMSGLDTTNLWIGESLQLVRDMRSMPAMYARRCVSERVRREEGET